MEVRLTDSREPASSLASIFPKEENICASES
jgi:hypothetical protein